MGPGAQNQAGLRRLHEKPMLRRIRQEDSGWVLEFLDLINKNTGQIMKFEFQTNNE